MFPEIPDRKSPLNPATNRSKVLYDVSDEDFKSITNYVNELNDLIKNYKEEH